MCVCFLSLVIFSCGLRLWRFICGERCLFVGFLFVVFVSSHGDVSVPEKLIVETSVLWNLPSCVDFWWIVVEWLLRKLRWIGLDFWWTFGKLCVKKLWWFFMIPSSIWGARERIYLLEKKNIPIIFCRVSAVGWEAESLGRGRGGWGPGESVRGSSKRRKFRRNLLLNKDE